MFRHVLLNQMSARAGYRRFGDMAKEATRKEFKKLINKDVFTPASASVHDHARGVHLTSEDVSLMTQVAPCFKPFVTVEGGYPVLCL